MVEVQERALCALEENAVAARECGLDEPGGVVEVVAQALAPAESLGDQRIDRVWRAIHGRQEEVLVG
jgi:hypothetical protein